MYQTPSIDTSRSFFAASKRWSHPQFPGSVAFGWLHMRSADIELTSGPDTQQILGSANLSNDLFLLGVGVHPWEHWSFGATVKYFHFGFDGFSEGGVGYDLGVHAQYNPLRFGVNFSDLGGTRLTGSSIDPASPDVSDVVPARMRPGIGLALHSPFNLPTTVNLDVDGLIKLQGAQEARVFTGGEAWVFQDRFALRTGYMQGNGPTMGFGLRFGPLQIDYSFLLSLYLQDEHRIGTTFRF